MENDKKPAWLKTTLGCGQKFSAVRATLREGELSTVCSSARCPNAGKCFSEGRATFMILGETCTRNCAFCAVNHGVPEPPSPDEPQRVAQAVLRLKLDYVVITSVTRDDLPDFGAQHFVHTIRAIRTAAPNVGIEILTPDFGGSHEMLELVLAERPDVFNHNVETVERLYPQARAEAIFARSLDILAHASNFGALTKSGFMVGLGETDAEVYDLLRVLHEHGVQLVTIGQYLRPRAQNLPVQRYVTPEQFDAFAEFGKNIGLRRVFAGPLVRSSFMAAEIADFQRR